VARRRPSGVILVSCQQDVSRRHRALAAVGEPEHQTAVGVDAVADRLHDLVTGQGGAHRRPDGEAARGVVVEQPGAVGVAVGELPAQVARAQPVEHRDEQGLAAHRRPLEHHRARPRHGQLVCAQVGVDADAHDERVVDALGQQPAELARPGAAVPGRAVDHDVVGPGERRRDAGVAQGVDHRQPGEQRHPAPGALGRHGAQDDRHEQAGSGGRDPVASEAPAPGGLLVGGDGEPLGGALADLVGGVGVGRPGRREPRDRTPARPLGARAVERRLQHPVVPGAGVVCHGCLPGRSTDGWS